MFEEGVELLKIIQHNIFCWECSKVVFQRLTKEGVSDMDILKTPALADEVMAQVESELEKIRKAEVSSEEEEEEEEGEGED